MNNVISFGEFKAKKELNGIKTHIPIAIKAERMARLTGDATKEDFCERMNRIRQSLTKINDLMNELKGPTK